jgi:serine phosphatase RsbU (regulator of sigma subunit)
VNRQVHASCLSDRFATLFYGVFDTATRMLCYANGGHNPPLLARRDGSVVSLSTAGLPLGLFPDSAYEGNTLQLHPGDTVIAYTDGVTEARNPVRGGMGSRGHQDSGSRQQDKECQRTCRRDLYVAGRVLSTMSER